MAERGRPWCPSSWRVSLALRQLARGEEGLDLADVALGLLMLLGALDAGADLEVVALDLKQRLQRCDERPAMRVEVDLQVPLLGRLTPCDHVEQRTAGVEMLDWLLEQLGALLFRKLHAGLPDQGGSGPPLAEHRGAQKPDGRGGDGDVHVGSSSWLGGLGRTALGEEAKQPGW